MTEVLEAPVETKKKTIIPSSDDSVGENLIKNLMLHDEKNEAKKSPVTPVTSGTIEDLTKSFQEKFFPLQKEGKIEDINKLRAEVETAVKEGKKVDASFLQQLELSAETPEKKQIRELTAQKESIANDLKMSESEKTEALKKLEGAKEKNYWEEETFDNPNAVVEKDTKSKEYFSKLFESKAKQLDEIQADPFVTAYLSAKESGKNVDAFLSEIVKGNPADLTEAQLLEKRIIRAGLTLEEAEEERDAFKAMSPTGRKELIAKERALANQDYQKNFEKYSTDNAAEREKTLSVAKQAIKETTDYLSNIQGKEVWGITYDSTQTQKLAEWTKNVMENGLFREDGTWDVPKIMQLGMKALNTQHMLQKAFEKGQFTKDEEYFQKYGRPSKENGLAKAPEAKFVNKTKEEIEKQNADWRSKL